MVKEGLLQAIYYRLRLAYRARTALGEQGTSFALSDNSIIIVRLKTHRTLILRVYRRYRKYLYEY